MMTFLRSSLLVLVMISSISVPICNYFHVRRANNGIITLFKGGVPSFFPTFVGTPFTSYMKFCLKILETLSYHTVKTRCLYLTWALIGTGCDRHQDRHEDRITIANARYVKQHVCAYLQPFSR